MSTTIRVQVSLPNVNGLPADAATNTWHAHSNLTDEVEDAEFFIVALKDFYGALDGFFSSSIDSTISYKAYDLQAAEPRAPIFEDAQTWTVGANAPLPHEVAICLSFRGSTGSGINIARRRGRIFLGPLDSAVMDDSLGQSIVQTSVTAAIAAAASNLMSAGGSAIWEWAVFSPTTAGASPWSEGELLAATDQVVAGFVDNSFDTIRSRGILATSRSVFPTPA